MSKEIQLEKECSLLREENSKLRAKLFRQEMLIKALSEELEDFYSYRDSEELEEAIEWMYATAFAKQEE